MTKTKDSSPSECEIEVGSNEGKKFDKMGRNLKKRNVVYPGMVS